MNIAGIFKETSDGTSGVNIQPGFVRHSSSEILTIAVCSDELGKSGDDMN